MRASAHSTRPTRPAPRGARRSTPRSTTRLVRGPLSGSRSSGRFRSLPAGRPAVACGEERKVDRLATVRFVSARYSVPHRLVGQTVQVTATDRDVVIMHHGVPVAQHALLAPGEASITDAHYPTPAPTGVRALRPRTPSEHAFLALGAEAEDYLRAAAAAGTARLHERLDEALGLARTCGEEQARAALARASEFSRFAHGDLGSI